LQHCQRLNVLHNYFDNSTKLFSDLAKFLNTAAKSFFPYRTSQDQCPRGEYSLAQSRAIITNVHNYYMLLF